MISSSTRHAHAPSVIDLVFVCVAAVLTFGAAAPLTQSDGDLFAHLRLGTTMLASGHLPATSTFGLTTAGAPTVVPAWLAAVLFAGAWKIGGLALVTIIAALVIATAHALVGWVIRRGGGDARFILGAMLVSLALGATHWLARPHVFTLLGAALVVAMLEAAPRMRLVPATAALFALWVNLHGGWIYGLGVLGLYVTGDVYDWLVERGAGDAGRAATNLPRRARVHAAMLGAGALATLVNPYGLHLHREVLHTLTDPNVTAVVDEYRAPGFRNAGDLLFLGAVLLTVVLLARSRDAVRPGRLLVIVATLGLALMSGRNIALFAVTGWTLVALHAAESSRKAVRDWRVLRAVANREPATSAGPLSALAAIALLSLGIAAGPGRGDALLNATVSPRRFPVAAVHRLQSSHLDVRMYAPWEWTGYVVLAWPHHQGFVDPLRFDARAVNAYRAITLLEPGWRDTLANWGLSVVMTRSNAPLAAAMATEPPWREWYRDPTAVVWVRRDALTAASRHTR